LATGQNAVALADIAKNLKNALFPAAGDRIIADSRHEVLRRQVDPWPYNFFTAANVFNTDVELVI
jgi:hypothetical protein